LRTRVAVLKDLKNISKGPPETPSPKDLLAGCQVSPREVARAFNKGALAVFSKDLARSKVLLTKAIETDPGYLPARYNLACALGLSGQMDASLAQLQELTRAGVRAARWLRASQDDKDLTAVRDRKAYGALRAKVGRAVGFWANKCSFSRPRPPQDYNYGNSGDDSDCGDLVTRFGAFDGGPIELERIIGFEGDECSDDSDCDEGLYCDEDFKYYKCVRGRRPEPAR
jgi:hypothetical protein